MSSIEPTGSKTPTFDTDNFVQELLCPVSSDPLLMAVNLVPCSHKLNEDAAHKMFGKMKNNGRVARLKPCPVCNRKVRAFHPDHKMRQITSRIFAVNASPEVLNQIPFSPAVLFEKEYLNEPPPYPGNPGRFVYHSGNWSLAEDSRYFLQQLRFKSMNSDSLLKEFAFFDFRDGKIEMMLEFQPGNEVVCDYFAEHGVLIDRGFDLMTGVYRTSKPHEIKAIFCVLANHNELPEQQYSLLRKIVATYCSDKDV